MDPELKYLNLRVTKVDEAQRLVYGVAADETPDASGEIFDYEASKPLFEEWSQRFEDVTDGKSVGNVREQHNPKSAVGKLTAINFNDGAKSIEVAAKIVDAPAWEKVREGVYTGLSIGGKYTARWADDQNPTLKRYAAQPYEVSIVDSPCNPNATFSVIKANGDTEEVAFKSAERTKRVDGEDLPPSAFLYVGDPERTDTWHLPVKFSTEEKTKSHIRNALARFDQTELPAGDKSELKAKLLRLAHEHGIDTNESEKSEKAVDFVGEMFKTLQAIEARIEALGISIPSVVGNKTMTVEKAKSIHARLKAVHKAIGEHAERHAAHAKAVQEDLERAMKAVGSQEEVELDGEKAEGAEGQPVEGDERSGSEALDTEKTVTAADLKKALAETYAQGVKAAVAAARGVQVATTGIGDRSQVVKRSGAQAAEPANKKPTADVFKAADSGDEKAQLEVGRWLRKNQRPATFRELSIFNGARNQ